MAIDEKSIYLVDGGDYQIYCLGYTQARTVTNDNMQDDPWSGQPIRYDQDQPELTFTSKGKWIKPTQNLNSNTVNVNT